MVKVTVVQVWLVDLRLFGASADACRQLKRSHAVAETPRDVANQEA